MKANGDKDLDHLDDGHIMARVELIAELTATLSATRLTCSTGRKAIDGNTSGQWEKRRGGREREREREKEKERKWRNIRSVFPFVVVVPLILPLLVFHLNQSYERWLPSLGQLTSWPVARRERENKVTTHSDR